MNIVLTQKDADFILKYIRLDARRVEENYKKLTENENRLVKAYEESNFDKNELTLATTLLDMAKEVGTSAKNDLIELQKDFTRCIELLTVGSEVTE